MKLKHIEVSAILALAVAIIALPAYADLVPTSYGFPVIVQNGSTSAFNQNTANAYDFENINIDFPVTAGGVDLGPTEVSTASGTASANVVPFGPVNLTFPDISQTVDQAQSTTQTNFAQTNEYAEFAYPFESVGSASLAEFGF